MSGAAQTAQVRASDPAVSVFVAANAGSGKTSTLVKRVARLLLKGARPEAILCVTYTKAAAAEMQRRLFDELGAWAVMADAPLAETLEALDETPRNLALARALFARALETPGGIKIQTIHAFCEKLLRRFPLEAGVSPGFVVLDDVGARRVSAQAREDVALAALADPDGPIGRAHAYFSIELDYGRFGDLFSAFEAQRRAIRAYVDACDRQGGFGTDIWRRCGFSEPTSAAEIEAEAVGRIRWGQWRRAAEALLTGSEKTDAPMGARMLALAEGCAFEEAWRIFCTGAGELKKRLATNAVDPAARDWLETEGARLAGVCEQRKAAVIAEASVNAISLALAYIELYEGAKAAARALDFGDLIERAHALLTVRADAAWVLYKLDGGLDHVLLDEAQDTAPDQWDIVRALTDEFFIGQGAGVTHRTVFAVGDEKQSIFSFQGAAPERFAHEAQGFAARIKDSGRRFEHAQLLESWRSAPQILSFVDRVFEPPEIAAALRPAGAAAFPVRHVATRQGPGSVELWPLEETEPWEEPDPWAPVDAEPPESANKKLAARLAGAIKAMVARGEAVEDRRTRRTRPMACGDVLILVRRRNALFHEIIRALKAAGVPVGGADRLKLNEHAAFQDLLALGRFARFPGDDLTLAALLRSPFCEVDEESLYDLAYGRAGTLWPALRSRAGERPEWASAARFLDWVRAEAEARPPFDFYSRVLVRLDADGSSMKRRLLTRLGREAEDAVDAFLAQALAAEQRGVCDLERFIDELAASEIEVKREQDDPEAGGGEVRVMTVHGAKGLEAPVVILPDTSTRARAQGGPLLAAESGGFLWAPRKAEDCPASAEARAAREVAAGHESLRLLYVALTRARDRLIVCGVKTLPQHFKGSWREAVERAFQHPDIAAATGRFALEGGAIGDRYGPDPMLAAAGGAQTEPGMVLPAWTQRLAPTEPVAARHASPSRLTEAARSPAPSPLAETGGLGRYRRGDIVHGLLQRLPDVPRAERAAAAARLLAREPGLADAQRAEMAGAALAVLEDARFQAIFGPGSRPEAALAGASPRLPPGLRISGRVDRLLVTPDRVLVADFKTNRPAPDRIEAADPAYVLQMAVYWAVLQAIFPGRPVEAALVWTDGPRLMPVPENLMVEALDGLRPEG